MEMENRAVKNGQKLFLAIFLALGMVSPLATHAEDNEPTTEESTVIEVEGLQDRSEEDKAVDGSDEEDDVEEDESAVEAVTSESGADIPMTLAMPKTIAMPVHLGSASPYRLDYTSNPDGGTLFVFECPEDGFYTAFADDNPTSIGVDYINGNGIYYQVYNAGEDGNIDYSSKVYDNYSRFGFTNPWYSDANGNPVYMESGKTYYLYLRNQHRDGQPHDVTVELRHRETQFTITNNSAEGTGAKEVVLNFETLSSSGTTYGYVEGSFEDLLQLTDEERNKQPKNAIKMSLSPGESKVISMIPYDNSLPWSLTVEYNQDYDTAVEGDSAGTWTRHAELHTYNMSFTCTPVEDKEPEPTPTPTATPSVELPVIKSGADQTWTAGNTALTVSSTTDYDARMFKCVKVDGNVLDKKYYDVKAGSTVVTLHADYLKTLSVGKHTLAIVDINDNEAVTTFTIATKQVTNNTNTVAYKLVNTGVQ